MIQTNISSPFKGTLSQQLFTEIDRQCDCACLEPDLFISCLPAHPIFCYVEVTPVCNNLCLGCGNIFRADRTSPPLSSAEWQTVLTSLQPFVHYLKLTGGEPTLHPEFETIIRTVQEKDIPFALFTNARWNAPERLIALLQSTTQCRGLLVSLHGATAASHDAFTGVMGSFSDTCSNIKRAAFAGLDVRTSTVITKYNWQEIDTIATLSQSLGAHCAVFNRYIGPPLPELEPSKEQLQHAIGVIEYMRRNLTNNQQSMVEFGNHIPYCLYPSSSAACLAGIAYCTVDPWGNVRPCNHAPLICGNLLVQSLEEIWRSETMEAWRKMIPMECAGCALYQTCHGGCRAEVMLRNASNYYSLTNKSHRSTLPTEARVLQIG
ncbi:MAG: radical SAM protein [Chloroflexi bacterium]|nr:radical SAM protein [Chloroflexota bacterium]